MAPNTAPRLTKEDISAYAQRCPTRLFDLYEMRLVTRVKLINHIHKEFKAQELQDPLYRRFRYMGSPEEIIQAIFKYAILSHRWLEEELDINDLSQLSENGTVAGKEESVRKFNGFFRACRRAGYRFVWFDSACIDQRNAPEVDESIRSMFAWYRCAHECFVHLFDTKRLTDVHKDGWFRRGWTLQELLAPRRLVFFNKDWDPVPGLDDQRDLGEGVDEYEMRLLDEVVLGSGITVQDLSELITPSVEHASRMFRYLRGRSTTRLEDMAYCLISLLDVHMHTSYGEGPERAFYRLQLACLQDSESRAIFNWDHQNDTTFSRWNSMLARSPSNFDLPITNDVSIPLRIDFDIFHASAQVDVSFTINNGGLRIMMCLFNSASPSIIKGSRTSEESNGIDLIFTRNGRQLLQYSEGFQGNIGNLVVGIYGWNNGSSYGVLLEKGNSASRVGYRRSSWGKLGKLPTADEILKSGVKPKWIYIK